jgi:hypothetical protein
MPSFEALSRYIDRFLYADGWRVSRIAANDGGPGYAVTLTKEGDPGRGRSVTRTASSAGEATFKACSSARLLDATE